MVSKTDEKQAKFFAEAFKEAILPSLDTLQEKFDGMAKDIVVLKEDVGVLKEDVGVLKEDVHKIERHLEKIDDRLDRQGKTQDDLQERVEVLESHPQAFA